uniref:Essential protein Yae1, N terminal n=1 Tax=Candidatus Kentrum sp. DK TaxID=2126562 RepID=A0A450TN82_9GAMM|nr:MAG: hypothetical protein BECKDK2373B_GA0170837_12373 [Candidatus Kentron sp. DK]
MMEFWESTKYVPPYEAAEKIRKAKEEWMERGMRKGMREGKIKGREEGMGIGREEGLMEGLQEGERKKAIEMAMTLLDRGMDVSEVSEISGLPEEEIRALSID